MNTHLTVPVFCAILQAELLLELFLGLRADGGSDNGVIPQQHEHRDALHTEGLRQLRLFVDIDLADGNLGMGRGDLLDDRGHHAARAAPLRPEIQQHGLE